MLKLVSRTNLLVLSLEKDGKAQLRIKILKPWFGRAHIVTANKLASKIVGFKTPMEKVREDIR